ncbi:hypothetical protein AAGS40_02260 [Paraburkholderia sp. PREW-6R]|uniref:hypothetical protein n=1 Tax=Paraburkholderia sp. PREW-6R TaxID=3141544 RepID=UPI0031F5A29A
MDRAIPEENYTNAIEFLFLINFIYSIGWARTPCRTGLAVKRLAGSSAMQLPRRRGSLKNVDWQGSA